MLSIDQEYQSIMTFLDQVDCNEHPTEADEASDRLMVLESLIDLKDLEYTLFSCTLSSCECREQLNLERYYRNA